MLSPQRGAVRTGVVVALLLCLLGLAVGITYQGYTSRQPGANDFYPRWVGGCALLREGMNPYSQATTLRIQEGVYGRPARTSEDQVAFAYPLYSLLFFFPLCTVETYALVQAIWLWALLVALAAAVWLSLTVLRWRAPPGVTALTLLWSVLLYHSFRAVILGQLVIWVLLALVAALWAMQRRRDGWAGCLLALTTVKPQLVYLAIPWILLWAAGQRRWRLWFGFASGMMALILGAMLLLPSWLPDFVRQALAYPSYTVYGSLTWMLVRDWLGLGRPAELLVMTGLGLVLLALAWRLWRGTWEQMLWMLGVVLLSTNAFTPRIATTNYLLLLPWAIWGFLWIRSRWSQGGPRVVGVLQVTSLAGLWALFLLTVDGDFERAPVYFPFPLAIVVLLTWGWGQLATTRKEPQPAQAGLGSTRTASVTTQECNEQ